MKKAGLRVAKMVDRDDDGVVRVGYASFGEFVDAFLGA